MLFHSNVKDTLMIEISCQLKLNFFFSGKGFLNSIEFLDPATNEWTNFTPKPGMKQHSNNKNRYENEFLNGKQNGQFDFKFFNNKTGPKMTVVKETNEIRVRHSSISSDSDNSIPEENGFNHLSSTNGLSKNEIITNGITHLTNGLNHTNGH